VIVKATNKMQLCKLIYFSQSALHVSGDVFAHRREHLKLCGRVHKIAKATISYSTSVRISVRPHVTTQLQLKDFYEILYLSIFRKSVHKIQVSLKIGQE